MVHATRRKQASSKIKHCENERFSRISSRISEGSGRFRYIHILILIGFCTVSAVDVTWNAKLPAFFGNVTYLQCKISDTHSNCTKSRRQWYGGPNYDSLCYEDTCAASNKYAVMKQSRCQYTLMIRDFSDQDVNCEYACLYGILEMRRNLTLDEKEFIYKPHVEDIKEDTLEKDKTLYWRINISKIFPKPLCGADLNGESITDHLHVSVAKPGFYFTADLQINLPSSSCGILDVNCYLGDFKVNITSKNFESCYLQGGENSNNNDSTVIMTVIIFIMLLVVTVFMIHIYRGKKLCFNNNDRRSPQYHTALSCSDIKWDKNI